MADGITSVDRILPIIVAEGFEGKKSILSEYIRQHRAQWISQVFRDSNPHDWIRRLIQGGISSTELQSLGNNSVTPSDIALLQSTVVTARLKLRNRAVTIFAYLHGIPKSRIARFLCITDGTVRGYIRLFESGGATKLLNLSRKDVKKEDDPKYKEAVFSILHAPPSTYDINRTSWTIPLIHCVLDKQGMKLNKDSIRKIIKDAGYGFRKAKRVLTSNDPDYREKLKAITNILSNLGPREKFFSIDEFGPFAVKTQGGRSWAKKDELKTYPQWQKSKGSLILTGALELSTNQMTFFFSKKKNTQEMIKLLHILLENYKTTDDTIFFSWDAASWHASKLFLKTVESINETKYRNEHNTAEVRLAPLPSSAQFLNVIESVFSGMARAIIHNSDYQSVDDCKHAIDLYFEQRNQYFQAHPKRAGNKIWGKEREPPTFRESNNCKDPRWQG